LIGCFDIEERFLKRIIGGRVDIEQKIGIDEGLIIYGDLIDVGFIGLKPSYDRDA
jgi:hypothetical protein